MGRTYERYPSSYPPFVRCFGKTERGLQSETDVADAREEPIMDKTSNLFEVGDHSLRKAFVVTDLVEEVVTADNENFSTCSPGPGQKRAYSYATMVCKAYQRDPDEKFHRIAGTRAYTNLLVPPCRYG